MQDGTLTGKFQASMTDNGLVCLSIQLMTPTGPIRLEGTGDLEAALRMVDEMMRKKGIKRDPDKMLAAASKVAGEAAAQELDFALGFFPALSLVHPKAAQRGMMLFNQLHAPDDGTREDARAQVGLMRQARARGSAIAGDVDYLVRRLARAEHEKQMLNDPRIGSFLDDILSTAKSAGASVLSSASSLVPSALSDAVSSASKYLPDVSKLISQGAGAASSVLQKTLDVIKDSSPGIATSAALIVKAREGDKEALDKVNTTKALAESGVPKAQEALSNLKAGQAVVNRVESSAMRSQLPPATASSMTAKRDIEKVKERAERMDKEMEKKSMLPKLFSISPLWSATP